MIRIDITHTTKPSERPFPGARLTVDRHTGIRQWSEPPPDDLPLPPAPTPAPEVKPARKRFPPKTDWK